MADLAIERDDRFVANERRVHRVAVVMMTVLVLAGAAGVFDVGPGQELDGRVAVLGLC